MPSNTKTTYLVSKLVGMPYSFFLEIANSNSLCGHELGALLQKVGGKILYTILIFLDIHTFTMKLDVKSSTAPELIDPVFAKTIPKPSFSMTENKRFELVFLRKPGL
jgi:hypothetical protein